MASSFVPVDNPKNGFTIVTQAVPGEREQYGLRTGGEVSTQGPLKKFLKGEPKALGTVQIMIGIMTFLFGIIKTVYLPFASVPSSVTYWASCFYIISGALSVAAAKRANRCVVTSSLIMNVISAVAAGIALMFLSIDMIGMIQVLRHTYYYYPKCYESGYAYRHRYRCEIEPSYWGQSGGISGVLLVFALLEFIISICSSVFACRLNCCTEPAATIPLNYPETRNLAENV